MRKVYEAKGFDDASLIRILLEGAGITAVIQGAPLAGVAGEVPVQFSGAISVWVKEEDWDDACEVLADHFARPTHCANCGYNLTGSHEVRCPECGQEFYLLYRPKKSPPGPDWKCPSCGEEIEGQFSACWKCGYEQPADAQA